jgi:hypothetical protein
MIANQSSGNVLTSSFAGVPAVYVVETWNAPNGQDLVNTEDDFYQTTVPEPSTIIIWSLLGGFGIAIAHRRKRAA